MAEDAYRERALKILPWICVRCAREFPASRLRELTVHQAQTRIARGTLSEGDVRLYLPQAVRACQQGVKRAHLISGRIDDGLLLELFTHKGVGTLVTPDPIETLRAARLSDIGGILQLIQPLEADGTLVKRNRSLLESEVNRFVYEYANTIANATGDK